MTDTIDYYNQNATEFFESTASVNMSSLYLRFLALIPRHGKILDAGCGSGRDTLAFSKLGYAVDAFDGSDELARQASKHTGLQINCLTFQTFSSEPQYDGVWACASLLHLPMQELPDALSRLWNSLKPGGSLYVSFKLGHGERMKDQRHFTDLDELGLRSLLKPLPTVDHVETWISQDQRQEREEQWLNGLIVKGPIKKQKLITGGNDPFLPRLAHEITKATHIDISVSFVMASGLKLLLPDLQSALSPEAESQRCKASVRILTCDYLEVTDIEACRLLMLLKEQGADVRIYETKDTSFHMKAYIFSQTDDKAGLKGTAFIGSSNMSRQALKNGLEWNYRVTYPYDAGFLEAKARFEELFNDGSVVPLSHEWIDAYEKRRLNKRVPVAPDSFEPIEIPTPTLIQREALDALEETRSEHFMRGLVVLATGMGKTWLAAFDAHSMGARKVLFVAHREEILNQAAQTFLKINPNAKVGYYMGGRQHSDCDIICGSVQTIGKESHLEQFTPDHFDYIVVDEFHHAAASTYRRLLKHFKPRFMLGLTATPDRSDQADILTLCDNNVVYTCNLFDGIAADLLCPFHYFGIFDEDVNYKEIPWRNGRFDPDSLSSKLATLGRARHALREWQERKQHRTLAFCVSIKHAEFMAEQFRKEGVSAQAVYGGSEIGRAEALEQLDNGEIDILFSVDLFNEGMDLPSIDTVMLLRPTESKILFLQQIGRGLRKADHLNKEKVVILDFIGNHHSFLHKPQALFDLKAGQNQLADLGRKLESNQTNLPEGCFVNYDLRFIDFLKSLKTNTLTEEFKELEDVLGYRPSMVEAYRSGMSFTKIKQQYGHWFEFLRSMEKLNPNETSILNSYENLLKEFETTSMVKSFKMVLAEAFQELNGWTHPPSLENLARKSWEVLQRYPNLRGDIPDRFKSPDVKIGNQWQSYWRTNPVKAWIGENLENPGAALFELSGDVFRSKLEITSGDNNHLDDMLQEIIDYRLISYQAKQPNNNIVPINPPKLSGTDLPYFPNIKIACGHFRSGTADSEEFKTVGHGHGTLDPQKHFIARASGNSMNGGKSPIRDGDYLLLERISSNSAGAISNQVIAIERQDTSGDDQYVLRHVLKAPDGGYILRAFNPNYDDFRATDEMTPRARLKAILDPFELAIGQKFMREEIPPLFGLEFNDAIWNVGHVALNETKQHVLLVTLNKQGKSKEHRYTDIWMDDGKFHWQSQNSTKPTTKKGFNLINHIDSGWGIHLFIRENGKLSNGKAAPFVYYGLVAYVSHSGSGPMSVIFSLHNPIHNQTTE